MEKSFLMFSDNVRLSENISEHFWKFLEYFHVSLHKILFSVYFRFLPNVFQSIRISKTT